MDVQMEGDNFDQRSEHVEQTYHDHRTQQQLNVLSVGVDPAVAHARESQVRTEAYNAVGGCPIPSSIPRSPRGCRG